MFKSYQSQSETTIFKMERVSAQTSCWITVVDAVRACFGHWGRLCIYSNLKVWVPENREVNYGPYTGFRGKNMVVVVAKWRNTIRAN